jgi:hypothetical protein
MKNFLLFSFLVAITGCSTSGTPTAVISAADKPWARHCSLSGISTDNPDLMKHFDSLAQKCEPQGACVLACTRSGCATNLGGCAHACSRGTLEYLAKRADYWADRPVCMAPPNNSFKPPSHRGVSCVLCATLACSHRPAAERLNSSDRPQQ